MIQDLELRVEPRVAAEPEQLLRQLAMRMHVSPEAINDWRVVRRSVDARQRQPMVNVTVRVATGEDHEVCVPAEEAPVYRPVTAESPQVVIVGAGPAGLFAALEALRQGWKPVVLERGMDVERRRLQLAQLSRTGIVDPDSNYSFGEGGAGAFSDGKLFTRSKKRGNVGEVLSALWRHGADERILVEAHPHIGSDKLPEVIKNIRHTIQQAGGEVLFDCRVERLLRDGRGEVTGVASADGREFHGPVILATGHSARDVYRMLHSSGIGLEAKGLAIGTRLEHPQALIDRLQYHSPDGRGLWLPAAEYTFVTQADGRGVYSFCMCPGGVVVPAATGPEQCVTNGMSASARGSQWANSGMVVEIRPGDFPEYEKYGPLELLALQEDLERRFYEESRQAGVDNPLNAPAQRMKDFTEGKLSKSLPKSSFAPGIHPALLNKLFPKEIATRLKKGFFDFNRKRPGFLTNDAVMIGLESRTSSPVRIPRDRESLHHPEVPGLYPAGEGAGYAGGIVSAAIDGINAMRALASR